MSRACEQTSREVWRKRRQRGKETTRHTVLAHHTCAGCRGGTSAKAPRETNNPDQIRHREILDDSASFHLGIQLAQNDAERRHHSLRRPIREDPIPATPITRRVKSTSAAVRIKGNRDNRSKQHSEGLRGGSSPFSQMRLSNHCPLRNTAYYDVVSVTE